MKVRTALISIVVSAALVGGAGYGAYYVTQSRKSPVEVVPVANVNMSYYGFDQPETVYGSVTSQVAQTVTLNEEYGIDKIFVKEGDKVKEGTPLFSYDMTLPELELEMQQLDLQTNELTLTRLEKELEKLKKTPASASLVRDLLTLTASAEEADTEESADIVPEDLPAGTDPETGTTEAAGQTAQDAQEQPDIQIEGVEQVNGGEAELSPVLESVLSFERLVLEIHATFLACGDQLRAEDVGEAIEKAVAYYRKNLAEEKVTEEPQEDGSQKKIRAYVITDSVRKAIDEEELRLLGDRCAALDEYQVRYVEMLIREAGMLEPSALPAVVGKIQKSYELLATEQQDEVENLEELEDLKLAAESAGQGEQQDTDENTGDAGETETGQPESDLQAETGQPGSGQQTETGQPESDLQAETEQNQSGGESETSDGIDGNVSAQTGNGADQTAPEGETGSGLPGEESADGQTADGQTQQDETAGGQQNENADGQTPGVPDGETSQEPRQNTVTFDVGEGVSATVDGQDVTNSFALAEDGKIVFCLQPELGYEVSGIRLNGAGQLHENETGENADEYVIEGIQTNDTIISVQTRMTQSAGVPEESGDSSETGYKVTYIPWNVTKEYAPGDVVPLQADLSDVTLAFLGWSVAPDPASGQVDPASGQADPASGQTDQVIELQDEDIDQGYAAFLMPEFDVVATARYQDAPDAIESYTSTFLENARNLLAENAEQACTEEGKDFVTELEGAIAFYQQWLSAAEAEVVDEAAEEGQEMEKCLLLENVKNYLVSRGREATANELQEDYRELCLLYVKTLYLKLDPQILDKELLEKARTAYDLLGAGWQKELEKRWQNEQADLAEQMGQPWETNKKGKRIPPEGFLGIGDTLGVYNVMQMFQDYLNLPAETPEADRYAALLDIWTQYLEMSEAQQAVLAADPFFVEMMKQYGLWEETEPQTEFPDYGGWDDFGGDLGEEPLYTADELEELIRDKEQEIKSCELDIRQSELDLKQKQRVVDGKIVKSTMDGTVVSIGGAEGDSEEDYFVKVVSETGLYAKGSMNELALEKINVGDTISGMLQTNGTSFTATIKEVSEYPDAGDNYSYGENSNASYYPFYALIDDTEDLEEGSAEIYLTATAPGEEGGIYLQNFFIRSESDGRTYVFKEGENGNLTKQYVTTGKNMDGYAMEIVDGLDLADSIAFPYGKNVVEGAKTKEVDALKDAYM